MGDRNLTLFALHTHGDTQFGPSNVPGVGSDETESEMASKAKSWFGRDTEESKSEETDIDVTPADEEESGGGGIATLLVALVLLAGIAMAARKLSGGETEVDVAESDDL